MGNCKSCCFVKPRTAKLIDGHGNLRRVKLPITAAEIMLEEPSHFISPVDEIRRSNRLSAMKADCELLAGKVYLLVPVGRLNCKVSESQMALLNSACEKRRPSSKVLPAVIDDDSGEDSVRVLEKDDTGSSVCRLGNYRQWRPVLEPISEGI
ncbi:uncharacterized protein LOC132309062 [Cornus florida]|uniref:uncharacterized protein LOC132309062 n=1 Tax=Cornus florida TaxID=4283 RepID=UPI00289DE32E|nr:uncharacterized protein LOC132309062 [Cornus florida]